MPSKRLLASTAAAPVACVGYNSSKTRSETYACNTHDPTMLAMSSSTGTLPHLKMCGCNLTSQRKLSHA
jgi:hypothetical protein